MSNWITITTADLYNSKAAALIDAANTASLGQGQADRVTGLVADVTREIRRRISKCNQLDAVATAIPGGLKPLAIDIIYCRLKVALEIALSDDERLFLKQREDQLDRIADGRDLVDPPDNPQAASFTQAEPSPSLGDCPHRHFTNRSQDG